MMDRKKTILIAVLINAGLLVVLFIAALTSEEESAPPIAMVQQSSLEPLFTEPVDLAVKPPQILEPIAITPSEVPAVTLPPLADQTPLVAVPIESAPTSEAPYKEITVKKGDSLDKIAKAQHITVDELIKLNKLPSSFLRVGQTLRIPNEKTAVVVPQSKAIVDSGVSEYYTVKVGDNPWTIAMKHHMKVEELLKLNALNEERARKLKPGDRLRIR